MKQILIAFIVCFSAALAGCNSNQADKKSSEANSHNYSPIDGNWETVSFEQNGKQTHPKRKPQQLKIFNDGWYSLVMYDEQGKFYLAAAGPYELDGNMYKETYAYHSDTAYLNWKSWQKWEMKEDTLIFYGFEKAEMPDGKDVTAEWTSNGRFVEKRVRVK